MNSASIFRLFVSSTFSDFAVEREALQKRVFPDLEKFCTERGARFQAIDLRWGITEKAQRVLSVSLRKPVSISISFLPAAAGPTFGLFQAAAQSPIC